MREYKPEDVWATVQTLKPIIAQHRDAADAERRLPQPIVAAFAEHDLYRWLLPRDLGGHGLDPLLLFDAAEEIATVDASVGWNFALGSNVGMVGGLFAAGIIRQLLAEPGKSIAGSAAPQGRAVAVEGGYRLTGRFAWASCIYQASWLMCGCFVFDGDEMRKGPHGGPVVAQALVPIAEGTILDTWHTGGMRGTGSTEFEVADVFVPAEHVSTAFGGEPLHADPLYRLPTSFFGFNLTGVALGTARGAIEGLKTLALAKKPPPPRAGLADQPFTQYTIAKAEALIDGARLGVRTAFSQLWQQVREDGKATMEARARLRRNAVHAVESSIEAVGMCYRVAGGTALFRDQPFERALRDVNAIGGHIVFQRAMMEDSGRVALGLPPLLAIF
jgi:alkylation response protein AidB-like acyl-CoA dehydrogenase